jgi:hypothetical protein
MVVFGESCNQIKNINMKQIIFFLLFVSQLSAQSITFDTSYVKIIDNAYYLVYRADYTEGGYYEKASIIGDTSQLYNGAMASFENNANNFADKVIAYYDFGRKTTAAIRENNNIQELTGKNPLDTILKNNEAFYTDNKWQIISLGTTEAVDFNYNKNTSAFRYIVEESAAKNAIVFSKFAIRFLSYPALGQFVDLYWEEAKNRYISQDGKVILRKLKQTR